MFAKTRLGFGRTELSLSAIGTTFCALSSGPGPRGKVLKGFRKAWICMTFWGVGNAKTKMNMEDEHGQILVSGALNPRKMISPKIPKISGGVQPNKPTN